MASCGEESEEYSESMNEDELMSDMESDHLEICIEGDEEEPTTKKKDKKLVFLSRSVLEKVREKPMTTGTQVSLLNIIVWS